VPTGQTITDQAVADRLPKITDSYAFRSLNDAVVGVNTSFAAGYRGQAASADSALAHRGDAAAGHAAPQKAAPAAKAEGKPAGH
jgi:hypothetical protein